MTPFSDFIRNATPEEKEAVYKKVIDRACEAQKEKMKPPSTSVAVRGYFQFFGLIISFLSFLKLTMDWSLNLITTFTLDPHTFGASLGAFALCWLFWNAFNSAN